MAAFLLVPACRAPFKVRVTDLRDGVRPAYYEGEVLDLQVHWDAVRDKNKEVDCQVLTRFPGQLYGRELQWSLRFTQVRSRRSSSTRLYAGTASWV